mgnify:CR=1 FL=1
MNSLLLNWIASALIAAVLGSTLWMAMHTHPERENTRVLVAQVAPAADAASAPTPR